VSVGAWESMSIDDLGRGKAWKHRIRELTGAWNFLLFHQQNGLAMRTQNKRLIVEDFACISCMPSSNTFKAMPSVSNGASFTLQFNPPSNPVMQ
jgi:hypothetical protein